MAPKKSPLIGLQFPLGGVDRSLSFAHPPANTTPIGRNVRAFDGEALRARGGSRPGLSRYLSTQISGQDLIQEVNTVVGAGYSAPGGSMQASQSGRIVTLVAVSGGNVKIANAGDTTWTTPTGGTGALNSSGIVSSASNQQKLYFVDGTHLKVYDPSTNTVSTWTASAGSLPEDGSGNKPRHICTWRGRTVLSGLLLDPHNWFMSAVGDPTDFDYGATPESATMATSGNNAPCGLVGDVVNTLIPWLDDILIFGCDHTIWRMTGDPMAGGQLDNVSQSIGMAWGSPWCQDPNGTIYFFGNRPGIYAMMPGGSPQPISLAIDSLLQDIDTGTNTIRMAWDDRLKGLHVFVTPTAAAAATTHFFYEQRVKAWWTDEYANDNHNPLCCCVFDGNLPGDRTTLIGSWDGYVRSIDTGAVDDDGTPIASEVVIGPLVSQDRMLLLKELQAVLGETSGEVTYSIHVGDTAEAALDAEPAATGTWGPGRNIVNLPRRSGYAMYIKLSATNPWAMEVIRSTFGTKGSAMRVGRSA